MDEDPVVEWWSDDPLLRPSEDRLGRSPFVARTVALLDRVGTHASSTVVGLVGPWGSGKSTTVGFLLAELDRERWDVVRVMPWALGGAEDIATDLLAAIAAGLPGNDRKTERARRALLRYGAFATPLLSLIPLIGGAAKEVGDAAFARLAGRNTFASEMIEVEKALADLGRPLLVVVEDVDRLLPDQLLALFKAIRVVGRLPHVHYLLVYDEQTLLDVLSQTPIAAGVEARAVAFLEKIVTLRLDQPPTRREDADAILDDRLGALLADLSIALTEDQVARLGDEREALLMPVLAEPRAAKRFVSQLHAYLPLVGVDEVDLIDFMVLTLLRVSFPRLYRSLAADRRALAGDLEAAGNWADPDTDRLRDLGVPDEHVERVATAILRLFPVLDKARGLTELQDGRRRNRDRRASDPDHVDNYFALVPFADEVSDAILAMAISEWTSGTSGEAAARVSTALHSSAVTVSRDSRPRLLRRLEAQAESLSAGDAQSLLTVAATLFPAPDPGGVVRRTAQDTAVAWTAQLLTRATAASADHVLALFGRAPSEPSALPGLLRSLAVARGPRAGGGARPATGHLDRIVDAATTAAWTRFVEHVRLGDDAPIEPVDSYLGWLGDIWGEDALDEQLRGEIRNGLPVDHVAARLVSTVVNPGTQQWELARFDPAMVASQLGLSRRDGPPDELATAAGSDDGHVDEKDITWGNRRRLAARMLRDFLTADNVAARQLPQLDLLQPGPLSNMSPSILPVQSGDQPDLVLSIAAIAPGNASVPALGSEIGGIRGKDRERLFLELVQGSALASWLTEQVPRWGLQPSDWALARTDGASLTVATASPEGTSSDRPVWRQQHPLNTAVQLITGTTDKHSAAAVASVQAALFLAELDGMRRGDQVRHTTEPLPAALSLEEMLALTSAVISTAEALTTDAVTTLASSSEPARDAVVDVTIEAPSGIAVVLDLASFERAPAFGGTQHRMTFRAARKRGRIQPSADSAAVSVLAEWLLRSGVRGYESTLRAALAARA